MFDLYWSTETTAETKAGLCELIPLENKRPSLHFYSPSAQVIQNPSADCHQHEMGTSRARAGDDGKEKKKKRKI